MFSAGVGVGSRSRFFKVPGVGVGFSKMLESESGVGVGFLKLLESESGVGVGFSKLLESESGVGVGILKNLPTPQPCCFVDKILVAAKTETEDLNRLRLVFKLLHNSDVRIKPEIKVVTSDLKLLIYKGLFKTDEKIRAIKETKFSRFD